MKLIEIQPPDPMTIAFHGGSVLSFYNDGRCTFDGNADEAAKLFYEHVAKVHLGMYKELGLALEHVSALEEDNERMRNIIRAVQEAIQ
jgi:hypothetical protein